MDLRYGFVVLLAFIGAVLVSHKSRRRSVVVRHAVGTTNVQEHIEDVDLTCPNCTEQPSLANRHECYPMFETTIDLGPEG